MNHGMSAHPYSSVAMSMSGMCPVPSPMNQAAMNSSMQAATSGDRKKPEEKSVAGEVTEHAFSEIVMSALGVPHGLQSVIMNGAQIKSAMSNEAGAYLAQSGGQPGTSEAIASVISARLGDMSMATVSSLSSIHAANQAGKVVDRTETARRSGVRH